MTTPLAADWYPDPLGRHEHRFWDGALWTEHVASAGRQAIDPPVIATSPAPVDNPGRSCRLVSRPDWSARRSLLGRDAVD